MTDMTIISSLKGVRHIFLMMFFIEVLDEKKIPHFVCEHEADNEVVKLAKKYDCPVISSDSDYYLNTVKFIHTDWLRLVKENEDSILIEENISIIKWNFEFSYKANLVTSWLKGKEIAEAVRIISKYLPETQKFIDEYNNEDTKYLPYLFEKYGHMDLYSKLNIANGERSEKPLFAENYLCGDLGTVDKLLRELKIIIFKPQIENYDEQPYYEMCIPIVRKIAGLLFSKNFTWYGRKPGSPGYTQNIEQPSFWKRQNGDSEMNISLNKLKQNPNRGKQMISNVISENNRSTLLNFNESGVLPEWQLFILALNYWSTFKPQDRDQKRVAYQMRAFIMGAIKLNFIDKIKEDEVESEQFKMDRPKGYFQECVSKVTKEDCLKADKRMSKYKIIPTVDFESFDQSIRIIHYFAELQGVLSYIMPLNAMLKFPLEKCKIQNFFKGTLLFNLCVEIIGNDKTDIVEEEILKDSPSLLNLYKLIQKGMYERNNE
ncbi:uncharacterized protein LOC126843303 [Adelges cooleyi]|uniref:uncharacterized protein LOC126843303 n=1 Tax=Adelges cooleyi TaxID=133065 RepID=UPI002180136C|nr:uncharacterized protein LOC126843303 [Adelges cooleyi]